MFVCRLEITRALEIILKQYNLIIKQHMLAAVRLWKNITYHSFYSLTLDSYKHYTSWMLLYLDYLDGQLFCILHPKMYRAEIYAWNKHHQHVKTVNAYDTWTDDTNVSSTQYIDMLPLMTLCLVVVNNCIISLH